jgi:hypothetical protein
VFIEGVVMSEISSSSSDLPLINIGAFMRTLIAPMLMWVGLALLVTLSGQPGVVCVTPMAWLLALWTGGEYIRLSKGQPGRLPLLGPLLVGAAFGAGLAIVFAIVARFSMPVGNDPEEQNKARVLLVIIGVGGTVACAIMSVFTAWLTLRRLSRSQ